MKSPKVKIAVTPKGGLDLIDAHLRHEEQGFWFNIYPGDKCIDLILTIGGAEEDDTRITLHPDGTWTMTAEVSISID